MADPKQYQYLVDRLARPDGRASWERYRRKAPWIDLANGDFSGLALARFDLSTVNLSAAILTGADGREANFAGSRMGLADLRRARLRRARLDRSFLAGAAMQEADLTDASLIEAGLHGARLMGADLTGANLRGADLTDADMRHARLRYASLEGARMNGTNLADADLTGAVIDAPVLERVREAARIVERLYRPLARRIGAGAREAGNGRGEGGDGRAPAAGIEDAGVADLETTAGCARVLGLPPDASDAEIIRAFRALAKRYHPDMVAHLSAPEQRDAAEQFHRVLVAYERMSGRERRPLIGIVWVAGVPRHESPYAYSLKDYLALAEANPRNANLLYNLAWKFFDEGIFDEAYRGFERVLTLTPDDDDVHYNLMIIRLYRELVLTDGRE